MNMNEMVQQLIAKVQKDPKLLDQLTAHPTKTIEQLIGVDFPDEQVDEVIKKVLANVSTDKIGDVLGGLFKK